MGKLSGKVAFITGAARGQGRSHAVRLAGEGADIIGVDLCAQIKSVKYPMPDKQDLAETVAQVEALDRRMVATVADVRDAAAVREALARGVAELGGVDIVVANAGIFGLSADQDVDHDEVFRDAIDVNLTGVWNTVRAAAPTMIEQARGGSIVITSSGSGLSGRGGDGSGAWSGYTAAKHGVVGLMRSFSHWLAPHIIRVNTVHPSGVKTPMGWNEIMPAVMQDRPELFTAMANLLPVPILEPTDISNAVLWLASDEARYVTGVTLPVDAGFMAR